MEVLEKERTSIADRVKAIAGDIFGMTAESIDLAMGPDDIDRWDSMNHLRLITEFETSFNVRLAMHQIQTIRSLNELVSFAPGNDA